MTIQHNTNASSYQHQHLGCVDTLVHRLNNFFDIFIDIILKWICVPFKDFFASVQRASKRDNSNRTPGDSTCFELGNYL